MAGRRLIYTQGSSGAVLPVEVPSAPVAGHCLDCGHVLDAFDHADRTGHRVDTKEKCRRCRRTVPIDTEYCDVCAGVV